MTNFIKKVTDQTKSSSDCCGVEIKEVNEKNEAQVDSCCGTSSSYDSCCG